MILTYILAMLGIASYDKYLEPEFLADRVGASSYSEKIINAGFEL
jgi:hypothetical protein